MATTHNTVYFTSFYFRNQGYNVRIIYTDSGATEGYTYARPRKMYFTKQEDWKLGKSDKKINASTWVNIYL